MYVFVMLVLQFKRSWNLMRLILMERFSKVLCLSNFIQFYFSVMHFVLGRPYNCKTPKRGRITITGAWRASHGGSHLKIS